MKEKEEKDVFNVAIMHGHSDQYLIIKKYVKKLGFKPRILIEEYDADVILENFRNLIWDDVHCVVIVLTGDDRTSKNKKRARQNVIFELGYCFGAFDSIPSHSGYETKNAVIVIAEKDIELFANIDGLVKIMFKKDSIKDQEVRIKEALINSYDKAKEYFDLQ
ncbi:TIR domain-containing protein [Flavobacterium sp. ZS1P14]|uniref:TIR domain-containing protein n=1 Tax=Flavobacterium sp. ZS1P14 TaxID=3401729 RepID=UPI003AAB0E08